MREEQGGKAVRIGSIKRRVIVDYLRAHPDFFSDHLDLLETLRIPHPCRPAVSLIERQLLLLREQNSQLHRKLQELIAVARDNDFLSGHMQYLALELIEATELGELLQGIQSVLRDKFNVDFTVLRLAAQPLEAGFLSQPEFVTSESLAQFEQTLSSGRPACGRLSDEQNRFLFQEATPCVGSTALIPLRGSGWSGLLAVASCDHKRFYPAMGTLFLNRMGELISYALQPHLRPLNERASS